MKKALRIITTSAVIVGAVAGAYSVSHAVTGSVIAAPTPKVETFTVDGPAPTISPLPALAEQAEPETSPEPVAQREAAVSTPAPAAPTSSPEPQRYVDYQIGDQPVQQAEVVNGVVSISVNTFQD